MHCPAISAPHPAGQFRAPASLAFSTFLHSGLTGDTPAAHLRPCHESANSSELNEGAFILYLLQVINELMAPRWAVPLADLGATWLSGTLGEAVLTQFGFFTQQ